MSTRFSPLDPAAEEFSAMPAFARSSGRTGSARRTSGSFVGAGDAAPKAFGAGVLITTGVPVGSVGAEAIGDAAAAALVEVFSTGSACRAMIVPEVTGDALGVACAAWFFASLRGVIRCKLRINFMNEKPMRRITTPITNGTSDPRFVDLGMIGVRAGFGAGLSWR